MSNQQSGYPGQHPPQQPPPQQPPYGQQPQYGPPYGPQYGGYPPPPPPPPRSSKAVPIVVAVVGALMLIGAGIFVVSRFTGDGADDIADSPASPAGRSSQPVPTAVSPTDPAATGGSPATQPTQPPQVTQPPQATQPAKPAAGCNGCLPGVTVKSLVLAFKAQGYACKLDRRWECNKGTIDVYISPDYSKKLYPEYVDVSGSSSARVQNCPQCPKGAVASLKQGLPGALAVFVKDASVRQQIIAFAMRGAGIPASGPSSARDAKVGGYRLSTQGYSGATVGKNGRYSTFYSTSVSIAGISEY